MCRIVGGMATWLLVAMAMIVITPLWSYRRRDWVR
jgi:hypothetical protein